MTRKHQDQQLERCQICHPVDEQTKAIILSLFDSITATNIQEGQKIPDTGGFCQLIKMIFHNKYKNFRTTVKCKHENLRQFMLNKLDINAGKLDFLCNKRACLCAKKNFHLDTISLQIKSFTRHFAPKISDKLTKNNDNKIQRQKRKKVKMEEMVVKEEADQNVERFNRIQPEQMNSKPFAPVGFQFSQIMSKMGFLFGSGFNPA